MNQVSEILIADRNPRIRSFLRRELGSCGYNIRLVENANEILKLIDSHIRIDLLILDPDFPGVDGVEMVRNIIDRIPQLPVVLYCIRGTDNLTESIAGKIYHVEKNGQSIDLLKATIQRILPDDAIYAGPSSMNASTVRPPTHR